IYEVKKGKLIRTLVPAGMVHLVAERRQNWRTLQQLAGIAQAKLDEERQAEVDELKAKYETAQAELASLKQGAGIAGAAVAAPEQR
ncbi:hypothetical protein J8J27_27630, partial [Mycobacterium tuberculosis]|nr:hypothetical protein [Mycobacterium tuberculosis]